MIHIIWAFKLWKFWSRDTFSSKMQNKCEFERNISMNKVFCITTSVGISYIITVNWGNINYNLQHRTEHHAQMVLKTSAQNTKVNVSSNEIYVYTKHSVLILL